MSGAAALGNPNPTQKDARDDNQKVIASATGIFAADEPRPYW